MNMIRDVKKVIQPIYVMEGAGVLLRRSIATQQMDYLDPFLLFDHFGSDNPEEYIAGFPMHPHRGIETVTYMLNGQVKHEDSMGNSGTIEKGDLQWMTAGSGILHEEMPQKPEKGILEGFQLWVNLPSKLKMTKPRYQNINSSEVPEFKNDDGIIVRIIAGKYKCVSGVVTKIYADPEYLDVYIPAGFSFEQPVKKGYTAFAYVFEGEGIFGDFELESLDEGTNVNATKMLIFDDGDVIRVYADKNPVRFL